MGGLICVFAVLADGSARLLSGPDDTVHPEEWLWLHFERDNPETAKWIRGQSGLPPLIADMLLSFESRLRYVAEETGAVLVLRSVNLNAGASADDMISLRMDISTCRIISLRKETIFALADLKEKYRTGKGPATLADFIEEVIDGLTKRIAETVRAFEDSLYELEERAILTTDESLRRDLLAVRRKVIPIRHHVLSQCQTLADMADDNPSWSDREDHDHFVRCADETMRLVEALDALRERAALLQEQIASERADTMNRNTYALSIVAAIFLPHGFLTGLLGINVGGMPGLKTRRRSGSSWCCV